MKSVSRTVHAAPLFFAPVIAMAHPGHFDGLPVAHAISHGISYALILLAVVILPIQAVNAIRRARISKRKK